MKVSVYDILDIASKDLNIDSQSFLEYTQKKYFQDTEKEPSLNELIEALIKEASNRIDVSSAEYATLAGRLVNLRIRIEVYGGLEPADFVEHVTQKVKEGVYDPSILEKYTRKELKTLGEYIQHDRDWDFSYVAAGQLSGKYLLKNRVTGEFHETPQIAFMLISALIFSNIKGKEERLSLVKSFYDAISTHKINLPTPIMSGVRSKTRQFSSCVLIDTYDSLDSISASTAAIISYISQRAGIGLNVGRIRALGSPIRNGEVYHTGIVPFIKLFQSAIKSCSQGGVRGGAGTLFFPLWHLEIESLLVLKNNKGIEENRARHLDYGVQLNQMMYKRLIEGGEITLFSPDDVPDLYEAFFADQQRFEQLYEKYEQDESIRKKRVKAIDLFSLLAKERAQTGRIYIQNVDHCNTHGSFIEQQAPVKQSNLCMEITLPTKHLEYPGDENGEIALCTLSAINVGKAEFEEFDKLANLLVRALDEIIDFQDYPLKAAEFSTKARRSLGIGVTNYAYFLAKNGVKYSDGSAKALTHELFERLQYSLLKASCELAKEKGACEKFHETKYSKGLLPIDTYKKDLDSIGNYPLKMDWEKLREEIKKHGLRNSTLTAIMPCETSSQVSNSTNGIEPPRGAKTVKSSKDGMFKTIVPEYHKYAENYEFLWEIKDNKGYIELVALMQKFVDQSISANTHYDPQNYPDNKVPIKVILKDILYAYKLGVKTLYYHQTRDGANDRHEDEGCSGGACKL